MSYPPQFNSNITYPVELNLDQKPVWFEDIQQAFFTVHNFPTNVGYGKYWFSIEFHNPNQHPNLWLSDESYIEFELKSINGITIYSGLTEHNDVNGHAIAWFHIKEDPLRTYEEIENGLATLTILGQLNGNVPNEWAGVPNMRTQFHFNIQKDLPNDSSVLLRNTPTVSIGEFGERDYLDNNFKRTKTMFTFRNLDTYGGKIDAIEVYEKSNRSLSDSTTLGNQYKKLTTFKLEDNFEMLRGRDGEYIGSFVQDLTSSLVSYKSYAAGGNWNLHPQMGNISLGFWHTGSSSENHKFVVTSSALVPGLHLSHSNSAVKDASYAHWVTSRAVQTTSFFKFRYEVSGSGIVQIVTAPSTGNDIVDNGLSQSQVRDKLNPQIEFGNLVNETPNDDSRIKTIFRKSYGTSPAVGTHYNPSQSLKNGPIVMKGPDFEEETYSDKTGYWNEVEFTVPAGHTFGLQLAPVYGSSIHFKHLSIKYKTQSGSNDNWAMFKSELPEFRPDDKRTFKFNYVNSKGQPGIIMESASTKQSYQSELDVANNAKLANVESTVDWDFQGVDKTIPGTTLFSGSFWVGNKRQADGKSTKVEHKDMGLQFSMHNEDDEKILFNESGSNSLIIISGSGVQTTGITMYSNDVNNNFGMLAMRPGYQVFDMETGSVNHNTNWLFGTVNPNLAGVKAHKARGFVLEQNTLFPGGADDDYTYLFVTRSGVMPRVGIGTSRPKSELHVSGTITADSYVISHSATYVTTSYSTGNTEFGDSAGDTHTFNGHITASGNISSSGTIIGDDFYVNNNIWMVDDVGSAPQILWKHGSDNKTAALGMCEAGSLNSPQFRINLGTTALHSVAHFVITSSGGTAADDIRVGIGTEFPKQGLTVNGAISASDSIHCRNGLYLNEDADNNMQWIKHTNAKIEYYSQKEPQSFLVGLPAQPGLFVTASGAQSYVGVNAGVTGDDRVPKTLTVGGDISASGDFYLGKANGAYVSASNGNLELSGSGTANLMVSGTLELQKLSTPPASLDRLFNSGSVSGSAPGVVYNTPTLHFNNVPVGYAMDYGFRAITTSGITTNGYFAPYYHMGLDYSWQSGYHINSYADDPTITVYRDAKDGEGSIYETLGYTSGYHIPSSGMIRTIVGSTMNYSEACKWNINFYHANPSYAATSTTAYRFAQYVGAAADVDVSYEIKIENINRPVDAGDLIFIVLRRTDGGSLTNYVLGRGTIFLTTS